MSPIDPRDLPGARVLRESGRGGKGNLLLRVGEDAVLKLYRRRRSALREEAGEWAARVFHRKRGVSVGARHEMERRALETWSRHGFDVLRTLDRPLPEGIPGPGLWFEYCPGRLLFDLFQNPTVSWDEKRRLLIRLGGEFDRRHGLALSTGERLLVHEKGTVKHVFVQGDRLVTFDFEGGFGPRFPLIEALAEELSGYLRSLAQGLGDRFDDGMKALIEGYASVDRLREIAQWGVSGWSLYRWLKRVQDPWRRSVHGKTEVLRRLLIVLSMDRRMP